MGKRGLGVIKGKKFTAAEIPPRVAKEKRTQGTPMVGDSWLSRMQWDLGLWALG